MNNDINVLHHLGIVSRNLKAAVEHYEGLGFTFTPLTPPMIPLQAGANPEPIGAGNRCAIFRNNYLEIQIAQHETPELVLQPRYMPHANGATSITEVIVCVQDPDGVASKYGLYAGRTPRKDGALHVIELGFSRITVVSPDHLQNVLPGQTAPVIPFLAGFAVSSNLDTTKRALKERGIKFQIHDARILVSASDGYVASVLFKDVNT